MTIDLAKHVLMFLNAFPPKSGLSKTYSPHTIMIGKSLDWKKSFKLHFGEYTYVGVRGLKHNQHARREDTRINMPRAHKQPTGRV